MALHFLDSRGALTGMRDWLENRLTETYDRAAALIQLGPLDIVIQAGSRVIPEKGHVGHAAEPGVIFMTVDPANPALKANSHESLERMFAHELHHAARWDGPGYGSSLGEALVSEGLAGHFAQQLFGGEAEPWERLPEDQCRPFTAEAARNWDRADYAHGAWFFGTGQMPRWLGYSLGFRLVQRFLSEHPGETAASLVGAEAEKFRACLS